jgi:hypothetical protein
MVFSGGVAASSAVPSSVGIFEFTVPGTTLNLRPFSVTLNGCESSAASAVSMTRETQSAVS